MKPFINTTKTNGRAADPTCLSATIQLIKLIEQSVMIWGTVSLDPADSPAKLSFTTDNNLSFPCENEGIIRREDKTSETACCWSQNFTCRIPCSALSADKVKLFLFYSFAGKDAQAAWLDYGRRCVTGAELGIFTRLSDELLICGARDHISFQQASRRRVFQNRKAYVSGLLRGSYPGSRAVLLARIAVPVIRSFCHSHPIWLINDRIDQAGDNGEAFFRWVAANRAREVSPVFVIHKNTADAVRLRQYGKVIPYGTWEHKLLYLASEAVFSSAGESNFLLPLSQRYSALLRDIISRKRLIYLQHGVTKSDLSQFYGIRNENFFGFITSAQKEKDFILSRYGYTEEHLWLTGMARFDVMGEKTKDIKRPKQITIMPTWRKYLVKDFNYKDGSWKASESFEDSNYVKAFRALSEDPRLIAAIREYGYSLAFRPHPNMIAHIEKFHFRDDIKIDTRPVAEVFADTALLINDYSSGSMDFSYLYRPVIFYQFDRELFFSGVHTFTEENINYEEDALGELVFDHEDLIALLIEYMKSGCAIKDTYRARIDTFFRYHDFNNCERIYLSAQQMIKRKHEW